MATWRSRQTDGSILNTRSMDEAELVRQRQKDNK